MSAKSKIQANQSECYISVDIESSGPIPAVYSMLSLGACVVGASSQTFYAELKPITQSADPEALAISGFALELLSETGRDCRETMSAFETWVREMSDESPPILVGFNASFDWAFINWYFHKFIGRNPFGIGALDIKAYYMGHSRCQWVDTTSSRLPADYRLHPTHAHNALDDAIAQAELFEKLLRT